MNKLVFIFSFLFLLYSAVEAGYNLKNAWYGADIINQWSYFTGPDPTHGYVYYAGKSDAFSWGYVSSSNGKAYIRSDATSVASGSGRGSVRLSSPVRFTKGLFLFDLDHMPFGAGTWPSFWTTRGDGWPAGGEIDVVEGVNTNTGNTMTLHTSPGCIIPTTRTAETGYPGNGDCGIGGGNTGCGISDADTWSYGTEFNNHQGGVYAMQWEDSGVYIWFFARGSIPQDITNGAPNPAGWGTPRGRFTFNQGCTAANYFSNHQIIIDNTFCGDWAGAVYPGGNAACVNFVQNNPGAFSNAYWVWNSIKVFQL